jgi:hypothetical protein
MSDTSDLLQKLLTAVSSIQHDQKALAAAVDAINGKVNALAGVKQIKDEVGPKTPTEKVVQSPQSPSKDEQAPHSEVAAPGPHVHRKPTTTSRIILTTYPGQSGIDPITMNWGVKDPAQRGPVVVGRGSSTVRRRNGARSLLVRFILGDNVSALTCFCGISYRRPRRLLQYLPCPCSSYQRAQARPQTRLHRH